MYNDTNGLVIIQKIGNGYIVTLPVKRENEYARQIMPMVREIRSQQDKDPLLEQLQGKAEEKKEPAQAYELIAVGNVFCFESWQEVLDFLAQKFDEAEEAEKE